MSSSNSRGSAYAPPNPIAVPFQDDSNKSNIIIVNSDIMILPGQHESQTEEDEYDDDDDTSSSEVQSSRDSPSPHPLPSKSSPHHAPIEGSVAFTSRQASGLNASIVDVAPVFRQTDVPRQDSLATNNLRQQGPGMREHALTQADSSNSIESAESQAPKSASATSGTNPVSMSARTVSTSSPINPTKTKRLSNNTISSVNKNKNNDNSRNDTHLNSINNPKQSRQHTSCTERSNSSIPTTNTRELNNDRQFGQGSGVTTDSAIDFTTSAGRPDNTDTEAKQHHPTPAHGRTGRDGNTAKSCDISNINSNFDNIGNNNRSSKYSPHGPQIGQHNLSPSTAIKPFAFFNRFSKENKSRKKGYPLQLLDQNQPRPPSQPDSTTLPEMNSATGSKNDLILDRRHLKDEKVPRKVGLAAGLYQRMQGSRKRGVPGKDGEEPETDMFKFIDIILDMPDKPTRRLVIHKLLKVLAVMAISYYALMALYFAAEFQADDHMKNLEVMVVDLDFGMVGAQYTNFVNTLNNQTSQLHWVVQPMDRSKTFDQVMTQVQRGDYWGAVVIMPNTSSTLNKMLSTPRVDFDPSGAFAFVYDGGRDPLVVKPYIVANMYTSFLQFSKLFNPMWVRFSIGLYTKKDVNITDLYDAPQILGTPVAFTEYDLHPTTASIITSATSVAYIWIFLVAGGSTYLVANMIQPLTRHSSVPRTMMSLLFPLLLFLVTLSMTYSILLLSFGVPFKDGASQFLSLFGGMLLLQLAVSSMVLFLIYLIPVVYIPTITITFVILNVIAVFNPVELMPKFYRWVYAMPFLNAVQIARYVLMGSFNRLHYNLPILGVWILVPWAMLPFAIARQKRLAREVVLRALEEEQFQLQQLRLHQLQPKDSVITAVEEDRDSEEGAQQDRAGLRNDAQRKRDSVCSQSKEVARTDVRAPRQSATLIRGPHDVLQVPSDDDEDITEDDFHRHHQNPTHHTRHSSTTNRHQEHPSIPYLHFYQPPSTSPIYVSPSAPTESQVFNTRSSHTSRIDVPTGSSSINRRQQQCPPQQYSMYAEESIPNEVK